MARGGPTGGGRVRAGSARADAQHERRVRIAAVAAALADEGGYDAVQMREVASRSDVALGTLYRYFPSKDHLLLEIMGDQIGLLAASLVDRPPRGDAAADQVVDVLQRATRALQARPKLAAAMVRAFLTTDPSVATGVRQVRDATTEIIVRVLTGGDPSSARLAAASPNAGLGSGWLGWEELVARILQYTWMASLTAWLNGAEPAEQVARDMEQAARLVIATR
jgi:TetR/AcrR family transcriptional regulator, cholesterol catabolism regulator